jgi:hypothetical protein
VLCRGLEKNGMVRAWHGRGMASVNQTWPHCVNQMGKTHSKPLAARHGRGTAWARHAMCESALRVPSSSVKQSKNVAKHQSMPRKSKNMTATSKCAHEMSIRRKSHSIISGFLENNYLNLESLLYVDNCEHHYVTERTYKKF